MALRGRLTQTYAAEVRELPLLEVGLAGAKHITKHMPGAGAGAGGEGDDEE